MNRVKAELLLVSNGKEDVGSPEDRSAVIDKFLGALQQYVTPEGIETFTIFQLRALYVTWYRMAQVDMEQADRDIILYLDFYSEARERRPSTPKTAEVVSIFSKAR